MIASSIKAEVVKANASRRQRHRQPRSAVALLTARINELTPTSRPTPRTTTAVAGCCAW